MLSAERGPDRSPEREKTCPDWQGKTMAKLALDAMVVEQSQLGKPA